MKSAYGASLALVLCLSFLATSFAADRSTVRGTIKDFEVVDGEESRPGRSIPSRRRTDPALSASSPFKIRVPSLVAFRR